MTPPRWLGALLRDTYFPDAADKSASSRGRRRIEQVAKQLEERKSGLAEALEQVTEHLRA